MSHKLISTKSVVYNAQTLEESVLTIVCPSLTMEDNIQQFANPNYTHSVNINGRLFAKYDTQERVMLNVLNYTLTEDEWDNFYNSRTFTSTMPYDKDMECGLFYIKSQIMPMFGLTQSDWIFLE